MHGEEKAGRGGADAFECAEVGEGGGAFGWVAGEVNRECFLCGGFDNVVGVGRDEGGELGAEFAVFPGGGRLD